MIGYDTTLLGGFLYPNLTQNKIGFSAFNYLVSKSSGEKIKPRTH